MSSKRERAARELGPLLDHPQQLEALLLRRSGLPGRRANLELAAALADLVLQRGWDPELCQRLLQLSQRPDPTNTPGEFVPFCALQALGAACGLLARAGGAADAERRELQQRMLERLRQGATDPRWRLREATCFGLQRLGQADPGALRQLLVRWRSQASLLELRALLVTVADPPLLGDEALLQLGLELCQQAADTLLGLEPEQARSEGARVLDKALRFVPSVLAAAGPEPGFALLRRWAGSESVQLKKIVVANLRKARLARHFPDEVEGVAAVFDFAQ